MLNLLWVGLVWAVGTLGAISHQESVQNKKEAERDLSFNCIYRDEQGHFFWYSESEKRFFECNAK